MSQTLVKAIRYWLKLTELLFGRLPKAGRRETQKGANAKKEEEKKGKKSFVHVTKLKTPTPSIVHASR